MNREEFKFGDIVRIISVTHHKEMLNCIGIVEEESWCNTENPITVRLIDINGEVRCLYFNSKQLQKRHTK
ncbi:hypothetical protein LCGC14_2757850 [marine sediment metagenome]|uniref:DUF2187 domain-containing protein n=1 Tax=marine sediment metagenome TaxID=412755 RepID=A0A0F8ZLT2_9ZZZZ